VICPGCGRLLGYPEWCRKCGWRDPDDETAADGDVDDAAFDKDD
jgi:hypothetical protein